MQAKVIRNNFLMFINSGSGGGIGDMMVSEEVQKICYKMKNPEGQKVDVTLYMFNMRVNSQRQSGFKLLKKLAGEYRKQQRYQPTTIVCGGDGTVMWVVSQFSKYDINPQDVPLAVLPLGTGNDFSRSLNWGKSTDKWNLSDLKLMIKKWMEGQQQKFDLWDMQAQVFQYIGQNGYFSKYKDGGDQIMTEKNITKTFCNYFSFGIDGKIGYSFDKYRTKNRLGNYAVYGAVGAWNQISKNMTMDHLLEHMYVTLKPDTPDNSYIQYGHCVFQADDIKSKLHPLMNILALNIDSYTGGTTGIWNRGKQHFKRQEIRRPQSSSDGHIQIVAFDSGIAIAMQKSIGGLASRISQGEGPYRFQFKRYNTKDHQTYLQIDGQFVKMVHPHYIIIKKSQMFPNSQIKVLKNTSNTPNFWQQLVANSPIQKYVGNPLQKYVGNPLDTFFKK